MKFQLVALQKVVGKKGCKGWPPMVNMYAKRRSTIPPAYASKGSQGGRSLLEVLPFDEHVIRQEPFKASSSIGWEKE